MKVMFLIRSLEIGGAERQLVNLAKGLKDRDIEVQVLTFYPGGLFSSELDNYGVPNKDLRKRHRWDMLLFFLNFIHELRKYRPDVLYSFLPVANIIAVLAKNLMPSLKIVWGVRASNMNFKVYDRLSRIVARFEVVMSRFPDLIVANSTSGFQYHQDIGFPEEKMRVIENGIDIRRFKPDRKGGERMRRLWGIEPHQKVVGIVGRLDPMKGHPIFLEACAKLSSIEPNLRFVCVGEGRRDYRMHLIGLADELGLLDKVLWVGPYEDMPAVYSAFQLCCSSSIFGEGFPNVVAEAMACGVPCVVTDVGDSARVVGDRGLVVPPGDATALSKGILQMLKRVKSGSMDALAVRERIQNRFSVEQMVQRTESLLREVI